MASKRIYVIKRKGCLADKRTALIKGVFAKNPRVSVEVREIDSALELAGRKGSGAVFIVFVSKAGMNRAKGIKKTHPEYNVVVFTDLIIPEEKRKGVIVHKLDGVEDVLRVIPC